MLGRLSGRIIAALSVASAIFVTGSVHAANADFQAFFTNVCAGSGSPTGDLATRCAETGSGTGDGDLSGDSESSLNPSQTLSNNDVSLAVAQGRSKETRERGERLREGESALADEAASYSFGRLSLLANLRGEWFKSDRPKGGDPDRGYDGDLWALELGLDYRMSDNFVIGGLVGYEQMDSKFDRDLQQGEPFTPASDAGKMESESIDVIVFGSYATGGGVYVDGSFGYRTTDYTFQRHSVFQESGRSSQTSVRTKGTPDGDSWWGSANVGYDMQRGAWSFGPYAGVTVASSNVDDYQERDLDGSGLNMHIDESDQDSVLAHLGFRTSVALSSKSGVWLPQFRVEYNHEFEDDRPDITSAFVEDSADTLYGLEGNDPDTDYFNVGLGLAAVFPNGWIPFIDGEVLLGYQDFDRYRVILGLRKEL